MELVSNFKDRLNEAILESGLQQIQISSLTGISKSLLNKYIKGIAVAKTDKIQKLAYVLKVNPVWLLGYDVCKEDDFIDEETISKRDGDMLVRFSVNDVLDKIKNASLFQFLDVIAILDCPSENYQPRFCDFLENSNKRIKLEKFINDLNDKEFDKLEDFLIKFFNYKKKGDE